MLIKSLVNSVELDDELTTLAATLTRFDDDYWARCDQEKQYPSDYVASMVEAGWLGMTIPEEFGGAGQSHVATAVILHEIAVSGAGLNGCIPIHVSLFATAPIIRNGSLEVKKTVLPKICSGETVLCFAVSEPNSGNDMSKMTTRARQVNGEWVISGQKLWVTQASRANSAILLARTRPAGATRTSGLSLFIVPLDGTAVRRVPMRNWDRACSLAPRGRLCQRARELRAPDRCLSRHQPPVGTRQCAAVRGMARHPERGQSN